MTARKIGAPLFYGYVATELKTLFWTDLTDPVVRGPLRRQIDTHCSLHPQRRFPTVEMLSCYGSCFNTHLKKLQFSAYLRFGVSYHFSFLTDPCDTTEGTHMLKLVQAGLVGGVTNLENY